MRASFIINVFFIFFFSSCAKSNNSEEQNTESEVSELMSNVKIQERLRDTLLFYTIADNNRALTQVKVKDEVRYLIIRVSEIHCDICVNMVMDVISKYITLKKIPSVQIWYDGSPLEQSILQNKKWYIQNRSKIELRRLNGETSKLSSERAYKPYVFIFDSKTKTINSVFSLLYMRRKS